METELFSRSVAAEWLAQRLPEKTPEQWALWLRNNANTARRAVYRVPVETLGRGSFYLPEELKKFVEFEKSRQLGAIKLTGRAAEMLQGSAASRLAMIMWRMVVPSFFFEIPRLVRDISADFSKS